MKPSTLKIDDVEYVRKDSVSTPNLTNQYLVRTRSAGVFCGEITSNRESMERGYVEMKDARRIWMWVGAASLSQLAVDGTSNPKDCKFPVAVPVVKLTEVIEVIQVTEVAAKSIASVPVWKQ